MAISWSGRTEFSEISHRLAVASDRTFEREALPVLRILWPEAAGVPDRQHLDRKGIDILVWSDRPPFPLVVQCKGFEVEVLGAGQMRDCLDSIEAFRLSQVRASQYLLLHNRENRERTFREALAKKLNALVKSGQVQRAEVLDRRQLVTRAFDVVYSKVRALMSTRGEREFCSEHDALPCDPLELVPLRTAELKADSYHVKGGNAGPPKVADPLLEIFASGRRNVALLLGEFGMGKTTTVLRALAGQARAVAYVPAATIATRTTSAKDLLQQCVNLDDVVDSFPESARHIVSKMCRPIIEYVLKDSKTPLALVLDGLDESVFFSRPGGITWLLNLLHAVQVPVILTARSEYWHACEGDLLRLLSPYAQAANRPGQVVRVVELLPWRDEHIAELTTRYRDSLSDPLQRERISELLRVVRAAGYDRYYGDIPRRPLFLKAVLETVAASGVHRAGHAQLFTAWVEQKIRRDVNRPFEVGGAGRERPFSGVANATDTVRMVFVAMEMAAELMTEVVGGVLDLRPHVRVDELLPKLPAWAGVPNVLGLVTNSLLIPDGRCRDPMDGRLRFAHRAFQEFFLARVIKRGGAFPPPDVRLPESVAWWLADMNVPLE